MKQPTTYNLSLTAIAICMAVLSSCTTQPSQQKYTKKVAVVAKRQIHKGINGEKFQIAFSDGNDIYTSYGQYSVVNIGDTVEVYFKGSMPLTIKLIK